MDFLRDPVWQFVGVIVSVVALLLTIIIYRKQNDRKEICWEITDYISLSSFNISNKVKSQITFDGNTLEDAQLVRVKIWNEGNKEILPSEYIDPIKLLFGRKTKVLDAEVLETTPINIKNKVNLIINNNDIIIDPILLNSKDSISLQMVLTDYSGKIFLDGRVAGVKRLHMPGKDLQSQILQSIKKDFKRDIIVSISASALFTIVTGIISAFKINQPLDPIITLIISLVIFIPTILFAYMFVILLTTSGTTIDHLSRKKSSN